MGEFLEVFLGRRDMEGVLPARDQDIGLLLTESGIVGEMQPDLLGFAFFDHFQQCSFFQRVKVLWIAGCLCMTIHGKDGLGEG